jgi:uncharacterized protein (DUF885 family)
VEVMSGAVRIVDAYWNRFLAVEPLFATAVGDARFDDVLPDPSEEGRAERQRVHAGLLEAAAGVDTSGLDPEERRTLLLAVALARRELGCLTHNLDRLWAVGHMPIGHRFGPGLLLGVVAFQQPAETASQRAAYLRRLAAFPAYLQAVAANAAEGLASGVVASRAVVTRTIGQVERLLATPVAESPGLAPLGIGSDEERSRGVEVLRERVYPAYARFLEVLRDYLPRAQASLGLLALPGGEEIYRSEVLGWTTLPLEPDVVHRLGLEQLQQVQEERMALARRLGHADPAEAVAALQGRPGGRLDSREAILARARDQVARSWEALPDWFGRLPGRNCEVTPVDLAHEDDLSEYYLAGTAKRAGTYFVNTRAPRPAYDLAATSFHEATPAIICKPHWNWRHQTATRCVATPASYRARPTARAGACTANASPTRWDCTPTMPNAWACSTSRRCGPRGWWSTPASTPLDGPASGRSQPCVPAAATGGWPPARPTATRRSRARR